jgi:phosphoglycolate phosphatase
MATTIRAIVFDFDGTIADTLSLAIKCLTILSAEQGYSAVDQASAIKAFRQKSLHEFIHGYLGLKFYQLPGYVIRAKRIYNEHADEVAIFKSVSKLLTKLAKQYELAIVTSNARATVAKALKKAGITCIKNIQTDRSIFGKHNVIKRFLKSNNLAADQIVYIGDEVRDVEACKKVGVPVIAVTWGFNTKDVLREAEPNYLADSCAEVERIIAKLAA